jgi:uncharacterized protein YciI
MPRYLFFYTMTDDGERIRAAVPAHVEYWRETPVEDYLGGPFADRTGGLITFSAPDAAEAAALIDADPFVAAGVIRDRWVKEWLA